MRRGRHCVGAYLGFELKEERATGEHTFSTSRRKGSDTCARWWDYFIPGRMIWNPAHARQARFLSICRDHPKASTPVILFSAYTTPFADVA